MNDSTNPKDALGASKPDLSLVPPASTIYQALAMENGAAKYGAFNWRGKSVRTMVYIAAALRHLYAFLDGEELANDSRVPHLAHALASIGILVDAKETGNLIDDRPVKGAATRLLEARPTVKAGACDKILVRTGKNLKRERLEWPLCGFLNCSIETHWYEDV